MANFPTIVIVGAGGVGCWLYASICEAAQRDPTLARVIIVARGAAYQRLQTDGLEYSVRRGAGAADNAAASDADRPQTIFLPPAAVQCAPTCAALREQGVVADFVILCVKTWQVGEAAKDAAGMLREGTGRIVTTQNGVEAPAEAAAASSDERVVVGIAKVIAFREDSDSGALSCVRLASPSPKTIILGQFVRDLSGPECGCVRQLAAVLEASKVDVSIADNIKQELWRKATMMCCLGPVAAAARADIHTLLTTPATRALLGGAMEEVCSLSATFTDCYVGDGWAEATLKYLEAQPAGSTPSTLRDVVCGRPSEVREMSGAIVRLARQQGVEAAVHSMLAAILEPQEARARGEIVYTLQGVPGGKPSL